MASSLDFSIGREAALVAHRGRVALLAEHLLQGVEDFDAHAQRFGELRGAERGDHELLQVHRVVGVRAAVDDVHHRDRQRCGADAAQIAVERRALRGGGGARGGHGDRQDRVGAEPALVRRAVERDHDAVDLGLLGGVLAVQRRGDLAVDVADRLQRALAEVARLVAVPQFHRFVLAGGGAGGHGRPSHTAVGEVNIRFHGRIAARIQNLSSDHFYDRRQRIAPRLSGLELRMRSRRVERVRRWLGPGPVTPLRRCRLR